MGLGATPPTRRCLTLAAASRSGGREDVVDLPPPPPWLLLASDPSAEAEASCPRALWFSSSVSATSAPAEPGHRAPRQGHASAGMVTDVYSRAQRCSRLRD